MPNELIEAVKAITIGVKEILKIVRHTDKLVGAIKSTVIDQPTKTSKDTEGEKSAEANKSRLTSGGRWQLAQRCILNNDFTIRDIEHLSNAVK